MLATFIVSFLSVRPANECLNSAIKSVCHSKDTHINQHVAKAYASEEVRVVQVPNEVNVEKLHHLEKDQSQNGGTRCLSCDYERFHPRIVLRSTWHVMSTETSFWIQV